MKPFYGSRALTFSSIPDLSKDEYLKIRKSGKYFIICDIFENLKKLG